MCHVLWEPRPFFQSPGRWCSTVPARLLAAAAAAASWPGAWLASLLLFAAAAPLSRRRELFPKPAPYIALFWRGQGECFAVQRNDEND